MEGEGRTRTREAALAVKGQRSCDKRRSVNTMPLRFTGHGPVGRGLLIRLRVCYRTTNAWRRLSRNLGGGEGLCSVSVCVVCGFHRKMNGAPQSSAYYGVHLLLLLPLLHRKREMKTATGSQREGLEMFSIRVSDTVCGLGTRFPVDIVVDQWEPNTRLLDRQGGWTRPDLTVETQACPETKPGSRQQIGHGRRK